MVEVAQRDGDFMIAASPRSRNRTSLRRYSDVPRKHRMGRPWNIPSLRRTSFVTVGASVEGLAHVFESSGEVEFELLDRLCDSSPSTIENLSFIFRRLDLCVTTYPAAGSHRCRSARERKSRFWDFNRATIQRAPTRFRDVPTTSARKTLISAGGSRRTMPLESHRSSELTLRCREPRHLKCDTWQQSNIRDVEVKFRA